MSSGTGDPILDAVAAEWAAWEHNDSREIDKPGKQRIYDALTTAFGCSRDLLWCGTAKDGNFAVRLNEGSKRSDRELLKICSVMLC
ncbi:MAG: hypothetical protein ACKOCC_06905, partial [Actinomycetota bacterium]